MKYILLTITFLFLGCGGSSSPDNKTLMEADLSGTWLLEDYIDHYDTNTNSILYSESSQITYFLVDRLDGTVNISRCIKYDGVNWDTVTKNINNINVFLGRADYVKKTDNSLVMNDTHIPDPNFPNIELRVTSYFNRVSNNILLDSGDIILNGPISINENSHVCVGHSTSNRLGTEVERFSVSTPYQDGFLSIELLTQDPLTVKSYTFDKNVDGEINNFDIFYGILGVGGNTLSPSTAIIDVTSNSGFGYDGSFSFIDNNNSSYTGSFEINTQY